MSYYAGNITAEMATVLRTNATILIRLREKMECNFHQFSSKIISFQKRSAPQFHHLCTVFHSACNPIILKRKAIKLRMLQERDNQSLNFTKAV